MRDRLKAYRAGVLAETLVAALLQLQGYRVLARRWKNPAGEIDLLACRKDALVIVEVKKRGSREEALLALQPRQRQRLVRAAQFALARWPEFSNHTVRFDLVLVGRWGWPQHLVNAWQDEQTAA